MLLGSVLNVRWQSVIVYSVSVCSLYFDCCDWLTDRLMHWGLSAEDADRYLKAKNGYHGLFLLRTGKKNTYTISVRYHCLFSKCFSLCVSVFLSLSVFLCLPHFWRLMKTCFCITWVTKSNKCCLWLTFHDRTLRSSVITMHKPICSVCSSGYCTVKYHLCSLMVFS